MTRARNSANLASDGNLFVDISNDRTGIGSVAPAQNLHVAGTAGFHADTTFVGDLYNTIWDRSANTLQVKANAILKIGTGSYAADISTDGTNLNIDHNPISAFFVTTNDLQVRGKGTGGGGTYNETILRARGGVVDLGFEPSGGTASFKLGTTAYGVNVTGTTDTDGLVVSGVATVTTMNVTGVLTYDDVTSIDSIGIITARSNIDCNGDLDVDGHTNLDNVSIAGVTTFANKTTINGSGSIGIGTNNPSAPLHISGADANTARLIIEDNNNGLAPSDIRVQNGGRDLRIAAPVDIFFQKLSGGFPILYLENGTNVGIGTDSPSAKLDVFGNTKLRNDLDVDGHTNLDNVSIVGVTTITGQIFQTAVGSNTAKITLNNASDTTGMDVGYSEGSGIGFINVGQGGSGLSIKTGGTAAGNERVRITADGNFGIGTNSPVARLHIHNSGTGAADHAYAFFTTGDTGSSASDGLTVGVAANQVASVNYREAGTLTLNTSSTPRITILSDGKVGINVASPTTNLQIGDGTVDSDNVLKLGKRVSSSEGNLPLIGHHSDNGSSSSLALCATSSSGKIHFFTGNGGNGFGASNNAERMRITPNGKVGIGTDGAYAKLEIGTGTETNSDTQYYGQNFAIAVRANKGENAGDEGNGIVFIQKWDATNQHLVRTGAILGYKSSGAGNFGGGLIFKTQEHGASPMSEKLRITSGGNIEVKGTRNGSLQANDDDALKLFTKSTSDDINRGTGITFYTHDGSGYEMGGTIQVAKENGTTNDAKSYMRFSTQSGSTTTERLRITSGGQLNLAGNMQFTAANPELEFNNGGPRFRVPAANTLAIHNGGTLGSTNNEVLRITSDGFIGIKDDSPFTGLTIDKEGDHWDTNGNTYAHPEGRILSCWRGDRNDDTDYWVGFVGKYLKPSATVNILLQPHVGNFNNQAGMYIACEATGNYSSEFTVGKIMSGDTAGRGTTASSGKRATKHELFRIDKNGYVGINTNNPSRYLHIVGNDGATGATLGNSDTILHLDNRGTNGPIVEFTSDSNSAGRIQFTDTDGSNRGRIEYDHSLEALRFHAGGADRVRIEDAPGIVAQNVTSGDGDNNAAVALQNDYSAWAVIFKNDWIATNGGWGTFWAGNSGAAYRRVSSDNNPNEYVFVGGGNKRFTFDLDNGNFYYDGSISNNQYDYAEYFEWEDGNPSNEDRRGYSVFVNSNGKIEKATDSTNTAEIIGVISGTSSMIGDAAVYDWQGKWKVDEWGTVIRETVKQVTWRGEDGKRHSYDEDKIPSGLTVPSDANYRQYTRKILNPDYDESKEYVPRDKRQEWDPVGLLGKVRVRDDSPKNPNWKYIKTINGKKLWLIR